MTNWFPIAALIALFSMGAVACRNVDRGSDAGQRDASPAAMPATAPARPSIGATPPPGPAPDGMVWIPGGTFWMGCDDCGMSDTQPVHLVTVAGFWMDKAPVTNQQFARFVRETGYVSVAERPLDPGDFPGVPQDKLVPGAAVFTRPAAAVTLDNPLRWWRYMPGANWRHPEGPTSGIDERENHPVVQIAWEDAAAYLTWAGKRLPTEAQYEFAARGGLDRHLYPWGNELAPGGQWPANIWQGRFPHDDRAEDGYRGTSPVTAFPPNGFGLLDMGGNVWQWCLDWYRPDTYESRARADAAVVDPHGPASSLDPAEPAMPKRVVRGGSFLCSDHYCSRFLVGSRGKAEVSSGAPNLGFRGVR